MDEIAAVPYIYWNHESFSKIEGVMAFDGDAVALEYQVSKYTNPEESGDGEQTLISKSALISARLLLSDIQSLEFKSSWFGIFPRIIIRTRTMKVLAEIAGSRQNKL